MLGAKKANAVLHKGAGRPVNGMANAKVAIKPSFSAGAREGENKPLVLKQNGHKGDSRKVDRLYE